MTEQQTTTPAPVVLAKRPPWDRAAFVPWGNRYVVLGGRRFVAEWQCKGLWTVWEVDETGRVVNPDQDYVAHAFRLDNIRVAVRERVAGKTEDEISAAISAAPRTGTGRNHPRNVERRRSWRNH